MKRNFTLIELLVVIAIITILASMLLPALNQARARAHAIQCVNTLKTLGQMFNFYANDNDGVLPGVSISSDGYGYWTYYIAPYYHCTAPEWWVRIEDLGNAGLRCSAAARANNSNAVNYGMWVPGSMFNVPPKLSSIRLPSALCLAADASWNSAGWYNTHVAYFGLPDPVHPGSSSNILYYDFHVNTRRRTEIPTDATDVFWTGKR